jgi:hypothetical protein
LIYQNLKGKIMNNDKVDTSLVEMKFSAFSQPKAREEMSKKEYAETMTGCIFDSAIDAAKKVISDKIEALESELRVEKASRHIVENNMELIVLRCRRAMEDGRLPKDLYAEISLTRTDGRTTDYKPENWISSHE